MAWVSLDCLSLLTVDEMVAQGCPRGNQSQTDRTRPLDAEAADRHNTAQYDLKTRTTLLEDGMKFGIFYELQIPKPWEPHTEMKLHLDALDQLELADQLGFDYAWEVEHHFLEEYSHSPAPEVFLGAASQRTKRIRLGHGIIQLTTNHPARVAERVATLDLLSRGRVDFGMGESASITELEPFGVTMDNKREIWEEAV
jgi:hypothetical protein